MGRVQQRLRDRIAVEDVVYRYSRAVDRDDWDLLRSVYHPDARIEHGAFTGGVEDFVGFVQARRLGMLHSMHLVGNLRITWQDRRTVDIEVYGYCTQRFGPPAAVVGQGFVQARTHAWYRYLDRVERRQGRWAVARALLVVGDRSVEQLPEAVTFPQGVPVARMDRSDASYRGHLP